VKLSDSLYLMSFVLFKIKKQNKLKEHIIYQPQLLRIWELLQSSGINVKKIIVDSNPSEALLKKMSVIYWPTWEKEVSSFSWEFVTTETALILEGECEITPEDGGPSTTFKAGDLVVFPLGYKGTWEVKKALKKCYKHNNGDFVKCAFNRLNRFLNFAKSIVK